MSRGPAGHRIRCRAGARGGRRPRHSRRSASFRSIGRAVTNRESVPSIPFFPDPAVIDYLAAKAGLANLTKSLSKEVGPGGVGINTVSPGPVATDLWLGEDRVAVTVARAGGRTPEDVAESAIRAQRLVGSPSPTRWLTSSSFWPVIVAETSPVPSRSTEVSLPPCEATHP